MTSFHGVGAAASLKAIRKRRIGVSQQNLDSSREAECQSVRDSFYKALYDVKAKGDQRERIVEGDREKLAWEATVFTE